MSFKVLDNVPDISPQQMNASQMSLPGPETSSKLCESFAKRSEKNDDVLERQLHTKDLRITLIFI